MDGDADGRRTDRGDTLGSDRRRSHHGRRASAAGGGLGWLAAVTTATVGYSSLVAPFVLAGTGMAMFFAPATNVVLSAVRPEEEGKASGVSNVVREVGGVFGVAVLASVFAGYGGYESPQIFIDGLVPATSIGAVIVAGGALSALAIRRKGARALRSRRSGLRRAAPATAPEQPSR